MGPAWHRPEDSSGMRSGSQRLDEAARAEQGHTENEEVLLTLAKRHSTALLACYLVMDTGALLSRT